MPFRYIFPTWMADCLMKAALETPLIYMEDVFVTGILAEQCKFERQNIEV